MSPPLSSALVIYRQGAAGPELLLGHPGGPYWARRDLGSWSFPKGVVRPGETSLEGARREFQEEVGLAVAGRFVPLPQVRLRGGKRLDAWMSQADLDLADARSNRFQLAWPPHSGRVRDFPELDRVAYFPPAEARLRLHPGQRPILEAALAHLAPPQGPG